jgi:hypothetical protein
MLASWRSSARMIFPLMFASMRHSAEVLFGFDNSNSRCWVSAFWRRDAAVILEEMRSASSLGVTEVILGDADFTKVSVAFASKRDLELIS